MKDFRERKYDTCIYIYIYIYIERERERERERHTYTSNLGKIQENVGEKSPQR